jgi:hypothetical protein
MAKSRAVRATVAADEVEEGLRAIASDPMRDLPENERKLTEAQIIESILRILRERSPRTTLEIEALMRRRDDCRDSMAKHLAKMRFRKIVAGTLDVKKGTWVWSLPSTIVAG